ncbi:MAG: hypothetical protein KGJ23_03660 [Euryarchaeota archaeon]|nr:hypothetical protein [Euryarchaeota archaeon]MDE1835697.1 hypothetical protein [Euryarchaeota archaeon]MDE1880441.1 hypothetical protein [Euryarchaeota archaeon]MDE2043887.1 hypothetical protein [Thermoplasmata archaeon]
MANGVLQCPGCDCRFNYLYTPGGSFHALRLGVRRSFKCPRCRRRQTFDLGPDKIDPTLSSYDDRVGWRDLVLALGPLAAGVAATLVLRSMVSPELWVALPSLLGTAWLIGFATLTIAMGSPPQFEGPLPSPRP